MADNKVLVVMGSDSDFPVMEGCFKMLNKFGVGFKATVASAHRTPDKAMALARGAEAEGFKVIIAAAGLAAHLGGVLAANTALPVIGVPCKGGALAGVDALYATVQMPRVFPLLLLRSTADPMPQFSLARCSPSLILNLCRRSRITRQVSQNQ